MAMVIIIIKTFEDTKGFSNNKSQVKSQLKKDEETNNCPLSNYTEMLTLSNTHITYNRD